MNEETIEKVINYFIVKLNTMENQLMFQKMEREKADKKIEDIKNIIKYNSEFTSYKEEIEEIEKIILYGNNSNE